MEHKLDAMEHRLSNIEATVEQIRQLVLEQQARPQVTLEQIHLLMQEQRPHRHRCHGWPRGRRNQNYDDEGGSENNWVSVESRSSQPYQSGGHGPGFYGGKRSEQECKVIEETIGVKEGADFNKSEFHSETTVKAATEKKSEMGGIFESPHLTKPQDIDLLEPHNTKVEKKESNHHQVMCEGIGSRSLKILIKHLPSSELKLLEGNRLVVVGEVQRTPIQNVRDTTTRLWATCDKTAMARTATQTARSRQFSVRKRSRANGGNSA